MIDKNLLKNRVTSNCKNKHNFRIKLIFSFLLAMTFVETGLSASYGFDQGEEYNLVHLSGPLTVHCRFDNGEAHVNLDCKMIDLDPSPYAKFYYNLPVDAISVKLSVIHEDGTLIEDKIPFDRKNQKSEWEFNLWSSSYFSPALLRKGINLIKFTLYGDSMSVQAQGEFSVRVSDNGNHRECRRGKMVDTGSSRSCDYPPTTPVCSHYFRYENYCR